MRLDVLILFAAISLMVITICGVGWEDIKDWIFSRWNKFKEGRVKK